MPDQPLSDGPVARDDGLDRVAYETFAGHVGETFRILFDDAPPILLSLERIERRPAGGPRSTPFSLLFRGPLEPQLPQRIYRLTHDEMPRMDIFIVPIARDADGMTYEAVFN